MSEIQILRSTLLLTLFTLGIAVICGSWLFIVVHRRHWWLRCKAAEESFYLKIGCSKLATISRRFSESRAYIWFFQVIILILLVEVFFSARLFYRELPFYLESSGRDKYRAGDFQ